MADLSTGNFAAISILAALRHAERTSEGQQIDISLLDTQIAMMANQGSSYLVSGVAPGRIGNRHPTVVPYTTFDVADGVLIRPVQPRLSLADRLAASAPMPTDPTEAMAWKPNGAEVIP